MATQRSEPAPPGERRPRLAAKQVSMAEVARQAGRSVITVSRALRHPDQVSEKTRRQIEAAMNKLGYVPNLIAGGLAATRTRIIAAIVPYVRHGIFADALQGLTDALENNGYCVLLGNSAGSAIREETIVRILLGHRPAGIVIQGANHTKPARILLRKAQIPVIEMGTLPADPIDVAVGFSNEESARQMTRYLVEKGHRRIGFISAPPDQNDRAAARLRGYRAALSEGSIDEDPTLVVHRSFGIREGALALDHFTRLADRPTAVFCTSDLWAVGMIGECARRGIAVPGGIAIAGFNDQEIASEISPAITTIRIPRYEIGRSAGQLILDRIAGLNPGRANIDLGFELIRRESA